MVLTSRKVFNSDGITIIIYTYFGCLYSASLFEDKFSYKTPLFTSEVEAINEVLINSPIIKSAA